MPRITGRRSPVHHDCCPKESLIVRIHSRFPFKPVLRVIFTPNKKHHARTYEQPGLFVPVQQVSVACQHVSIRCDLKRGKRRSMGRPMASRGGAPNLQIDAYSRPEVPSRPPPRSHQVGEKTSLGRMAASSYFTSSRSQTEWLHHLSTITAD